MSDDFQKSVMEWFAVLNTQLSAIDSRLEAIDFRLEAVDSRLEACDYRMQAIESRIVTLDLRLTEVESPKSTEPDEEKPVWKSYGPKWLFTFRGG